MRLTGIHAQGVTTLADGLAKLGAGQMTQDDFNQLQTLLQQQQSNLTQGFVVQKVPVTPIVPPGTTP